MKLLIFPEPVTYCPALTTVQYVQINYNALFLLFKCRLIIAQMSDQRSEVFNYLFIPLVVAISMAFVYPQYEILTLYALFAVVITTHLHFGISIVS